ncbi:MAG: L,D-transpeptidase family protein [Thiovulaceae bacterium]|nr:L,D-transpeptidase family protein [Sulfurimonadaceae bacterium]
MHIFVYAAQIVLVVAQNTDTSKAILQRYENNQKVGNPIDVNIGKNGLAHGLGISSFKINNKESDKIEGDKKAPIGVFKLHYLFGYEKKDKNYNMNYIQVDEKYTCIDDAQSIYYNSVLNFVDKDAKSFEYMKRDDDQYKLGIVVGHNDIKKPNAGSCIFIHVQKAVDAPTAGCTSMSYEDLKELVSWLDSKKDPILIQVAKEHLNQVKKQYPNLEL